MESTPGTFALLLFPFFQFNWEDTKEKDRNKSKGRKKCIRILVSCKKWDDALEAQSVIDEEDFLAMKILGKNPFLVPLILLHSKKNKREHQRRENRNHHGSNRVLLLSCSHQKRKENTESASELKWVIPSSSIPQFPFFARRALSSPLLTEVDTMRERPVWCSSH